MRGVMTKNEIRRVQKNEATVVGDIYPVVRTKTDLWSLDHALGFRGDLGLPLRSLVELYGAEHSGKSTLAWYLAAKIKSTGTIWVADLEGTIDPSYIKTEVENAGFQGTVRVADYGESKKGGRTMRSHEAQLQDSIDALLQDEVNAAVIDSIGMFFPIVDRSKDLGERSVGQRAKTIADASRRIIAWLRVVEAPKLAVYINHVHPNIGGRGFDTPGGETKKFAANVRIWLLRIESDIPEGTGNFLAEARIQKLKFGGASSDRRGLVFFIPGFGVSREMTAVFDCIRLEIAERGAVIKMEQMDADDKEFKSTSMGRMGTFVERAMEPEKNRKTFEPFYEALEKYEEKMK